MRSQIAPRILASSSLKNLQAPFVRLQERLGAETAASNAACRKLRRLTVSDIFLRNLARVTRPYYSN